MVENKKLDRFSKQTDSYAQSRPKYPAEIYKFLAGITPSNEKVWDCATGNGQAAIHLAEYFKGVYATDLSQEQIQKAFKHDRIKYEVGSAEDVTIEPNSLDLVTVAQAVHWFDLDKFYQKVNESLKAEGVIALWAYGFITAKNKDIDQLFQRVGRELLKEYWDENVKKIWNGYENIPFPFIDINHPEWKMDFKWSKQDFISYIESWSAAQKYYDENEVSVIEAVSEELDNIWLDNATLQEFETPLTSRIGRKQAA